MGQTSTFNVDDGSGLNTNITNHVDQFGNSTTQVNTSNNMAVPNFSDPDWESKLLGGLQNLMVAIPVSMPAIDPSRVLYHTEQHHYDTPTYTQAVRVLPGSATYTAW